MNQSCATCTHLFTMTGPIAACFHAAAGKLGEPTHESLRANGHCGKDLRGYDRALPNAANTYVALKRKAP